MRVLLKTIQELINSGFTTDMEGNLKKDGVFIDIRDARVYSGTWQDARLYKDERFCLPCFVRFYFTVLDSYLFVGNRVRFEIL